ncbi:MAG: cell division protein FtsZ [Paracoccus sp. (in: a-proteobacteria)]|jgi:cell division protein FtsZ|uniref:cell division protein FtsZ n=2 Tax=Paracoccus TaxID=265 RepID=UPI000C36020D|nr:MULTISPECIES: cell division protein FtsZ [unclassified Paracoccus (in: a-proteobacteria)]MAN55445.1 cell division protein FtsZ [Paracoccus sp. (in: a-proteobacteria)]MBA49226.1 cell division protein FtsZ [Paracoccus sp. (in: a-proteobacteria)]MCS5600893.1 cell division protein FtsZ [Paracoccus sp. (in: a-proteobacteria)]MDB2551408.1 cell division protein FtsZ [Paracoccus sp. (in: a-proteobacteria)]|tara:strand:- start:3778 stop:5391 length:1614 start_codon:yes stop_codon:yes gene_type:complete
MNLNLNLMMNDEEELKPRITVFGVGGAGGNAVNNMIEKQLDGVEFVVANTDAQALAGSRANNRIQMGPKVTEGLGAGAKPVIGAKAAEETIEDIVDHLMGAHMCFITAGMGGGTGTGAAPIIAQAAREMGILTVGVVTKPFQFEGSKRMRQAEEGVEALQKVVDTLIIIPNQNLFRLANEKTTFTEAFAMADDVLYQGVKGVTDLMVRPGLINLDFADVRAVMDEMGKAMMGTGEAAGENRAQEAAERAIANPLLDEISLNGAKGVLINITGGYDMTLFELDEAANVIRDKVDSDANIIVGSTLDPDMDGSIRVSVVATGIDAAAAAAAEAPAPRRSMAEPLTQNPTMTRKEEPAAEAEESVPPRRTAAPVEARNPAPAPAPQATEDMPQPAYQPRPTARPAAVRIDEPSESFFAPRAASTPARGEPAPEVLDRLRKAVAHGGERRAQQAAAQQPQHQDAARGQSRMAGLGRMLERMAGHGEQGGASKPAASSIAERVSDRVAARARQQDADFDDLASPDSAQDDVEIPAFLRRQAN